MNSVEAESSYHIIGTTVEFSYKPAHYLEAPVVQQRADYQLSVADGVARAALARVQDPVPESLMVMIRSHAESILGARQLLIHQQYELADRPRTVQLRSDGKTNQTIHMGSAALLLHANPVDILVTDATGSVVKDTRAERIAEHQQFISMVSEAVGKHDLVGQLLKSYRAAVEDPHDEMVHLYEIRDALKRFFGSEEEARKRLGVTKREWQALGEIANARPIAQSRHRGDHIAGRREATLVELETARSAARLLIEGFIRSI